MVTTLGFRSKLKPLLKRIQGLIQSTGVFKKTSQGDIFEILLSTVMYERSQGNDLFSKEKLLKVKEFNKKLKEEFYDGGFDEGDLE